MHVFCSSSRFATTSRVSSNNMRFWFSIHCWFLVFLFSANWSPYIYRAVPTEWSNLLVIWTDSGVSLLEIIWSLIIFFATIESFDILTLITVLLTLKLLSAEAWPWLKVNLIFTRKDNSLKLCKSMSLK